jgi:nitrate reductase beta subunit
VILYDANRIKEAASAKTEQEVYPAHLDMILDPKDPEIQKSAASQGMPKNFMDAALRSPVYMLAKEWKLALPLHPEYRTLPMVWYIPPLSPINEHTKDAEGLDVIDSMRIPITYLANLLTAGDETPVRLALKRLMAMREYMRSVRIKKSPDDSVLEAVGLTVESAVSMYELLSIAKFENRFVVPTMNEADENQLYTDQGECGYPGEN